MTPSGIEPATFWFVAQHLNQCATAVPFIYIYIYIYIYISNSGPRNLTLCCCSFFLRNNADVMGQECYDMHSKPSVSVSRRTSYISITKTNPLMLFREVMVGCSENRIKPINKLCEQNAELFDIKADSTISFALIAFLSEGFIQCGCFGKHAWRFWNLFISLKYTSMS